MGVAVELVNDSLAGADSAGTDDGAAAAAVTDGRPASSGCLPGPERWGRIWTSDRSASTSRRCRPGRC
ncbi:hypothetical protein A5727_06145 [Mycobacterium sp. ACS4331]|nr:hypothetical protein A5727_06145 [Mycobacterium sp. ACS4331]